MPNMTQTIRQKTSYVCSTDDIKIVLVLLNCIAMSCSCVSGPSFGAHATVESILQFGRHSWRLETETGPPSVADPGRKTLCAADLQRETRLQDVNRGTYLVLRAGDLTQYEHFSRSSPKP